MTMENLRGDILSNIFVRLSAKQLAQMRCVAKYWNALLCESSFIKSHLHHSIHNNNRVLLVFPLDEYDEFPILYTAYLQRSPRIELPNFIQLPRGNPKYGNNSSMIGVIGSVHGLICSSYHDDDVIHIWNPSLSAVSTLPPHAKPSGCDYKIYFQFGYDPDIDAYKVVKLTGLCRPSSVSSSRFTHLSYVVTQWLPVEVYSVRKGLWELITQRFPSHITGIVRRSLCVNELDGHLHWLGYIDEEMKLQTIVAFDMGSETFLDIPLPDSVHDDEGNNVLGVLGGKLCVMSQGWSSTIEVWVMDEYGMAESWVKRHLIIHTCSTPLTFGVSPHNELLIEGHDHDLDFYAPIKETANFLDYFSNRRYTADKVIEYVDSLVWVATHKR